MYASEDHLLRSAPMHTRNYMFILCFDVWINLKMSINVLKRRCNDLIERSGLLHKCMAENGPNFEGFLQRYYKMDDTSWAFNIYLRSQVRFSWYILFIKMNKTCTQREYIFYSITKKSWPILYNNLLYEVGQDFLVIW